LSDRIKSLIIYAAKCATGSLAIFSIASLINFTDLSWCLISVILVLSPDAKDSVALAVTRIKANIVGAGVGVLCMLIYQPNMWMISLALVITLSLCYLFKLDAGIRSALAASIIIMLHQEGRHLWDAALERIVSVLAGCLLALIITFLFHFRMTSKVNSAASNKNQQEA